MAPAEPSPAVRPTANEQESIRERARQAVAAATGQPGAGSDAELSILAMPAPPQFGPFPGVTPIATRPSDEEAEATRPHVKSAGEAPVQIPRSAHVTYKATGTVRGVPVDVPSRLVWRHDGTFYESNWIFYHVKAGEKSHYSNGLITPQGLAPLQASYRSPERQEMRFDHEGERLELKPELAEWKMPPGTQDRLSLIVQLSSLLAAEPERYPPGSSITLPLASANPPSVHEWSFVVGQEEQMVEGMSGKPLRTVHLVHEPTQDGDTRMELWLAPALEYLPAHVRIIEPDGDSVDFVVHQAYGVEVETRKQ